MYFFLLVTYRGKRKGLDFYKIITLLYLLTAICCALNYAQHPNIYPTLGFIPFLYIFVVLIILFQPLRGFDQDKKELALFDNRAMMSFAWMYIILAFVDTSTSITDAIERFQSGEWGALRNQLYEDADNIELYANQWQRLVKNLLAYTRPFTFVYAFFSLTQERRSSIFIILLFASIIVPSFISATVVASRGMVFQLAMEIFFGYWMFKDFISKSRKRFLLVGALLMSALFLFYSITVSISRFGEDEAGGSIFSYFGHSMLAFNDQMFYKMHDFAWGKRFFSWFIDAMGGNSTFDFAKAGSTHGTAFFTIVGDIFCDWGHIVTIPIAITVSLLVRQFTQKKTLYFSDLIVIFFYIKTLSAGIFVIGKGQALNWLMMFIMYFIVRAMERRIKTYKK